MKQDDGPLIFALIAIVIAIGLLAIAQSHDKGSTAEWASAVFNGLAIFAALWVASKASRSENARNQSRGLVCAHKLLPIIIRIDNRTSDARTYAIEKNCGVEEFGDQQFDLKVRAGLVIDLDIPDDYFSGAWALPPGIAKNCINLQSYLRQYRQLSELGIPKITKMEFAALTDWIKAMHISLHAVKSLADQARTELAQLLAQ